MQTCHSWLTNIWEEDDFCVILQDNRGKYKRTQFYDVYPQLEIETKAFVHEKCKGKKCSFNVRELANFINDRFIEYYSPHSSNPLELIRSESS